MVPTAKLYSFCFLIPLILLYSRLVDLLRRHHLLYCFTLVHGIGGIVFFFLLSHPVYGIANTQVDTTRVVGWAYYFFMESFDAFFSTSFWAFADSINNPKDAKNYYGIIVSGSKIGGILTSAFLYFTLASLPLNGEFVFIPRMFLFGSILLFAAAFSIYLLVKKVPEGKMHGYEQVYQLEKKKTKKGIGPNWFHSCVDGLWIMIRNPYVLGIFSLVFCYEIIIVVFDYYVQLQADQAYPSIGGMTGYYALFYLIMNGIGLAISFLGTTPILRVLGIRLSLMIFPVMCLGMLFVTMAVPGSWILFAVLIGLKAVNYAFNHPTREVLYIPTTKDIKFKAKAWTDAFGSRIAKTSGSVLNLFMKSLQPAIALLSSVGICMGLTSFWIVVSYLLGRKLQHALDNKLVIGEEEKEPTENTTSTMAATQE